jgi:hypothetical protein
VQKLDFQIVEHLQTYPAHVGVEGVLVELVVQVLGGQDVGNQQQSVDVLFVDYELGVVLLRPVQQNQRIHENTDGAVHILEHAYMRGKVRTR